MLLHPTLEKLTTLHLTGMAAGLKDQANIATIAELGFEERLGLLLDREQTVRENARMQTRLRKAKLRQNGSIEPEFPRSYNDKKYKSFNISKLTKRHLPNIVTMPWVVTMFLCDTNRITRC